MKIVLINASARKNGATAKILKEFADKLSSKSGVELCLVNLSDIKLNFCLGCCQCYKKGVCHIINKKITASIETQSSKLYESILNKRAAAKDRIVHYFVFNFGIKPFVLKKGDLYSGVIEHWEKRKIHIK